jgi:hypothetical protein
MDSLSRSGLRGIGQNPPHQPPLERDGGNDGFHGLGSLFEGSAPFQAASPNSEGYVMLAVPPPDDPERGLVARLCAGRPRRASEPSACVFGHLTFTLRLTSGAATGHGAGLRGHHESGAHQELARPVSDHLCVCTEGKSGLIVGAPPSTSCSRPASGAKSTCPTFRFGASSIRTTSSGLVLEVLSGDVAVGRPILTAPDVPIDRVTALRKRRY